MCKCPCKNGNKQNGQKVELGFNFTVFNNQQAVPVHIWQREQYVDPFFWLFSAIHTCSSLAQDHVLYHLKDSKLWLKTDFLSDLKSNEKVWAKSFNS